MCTSEGTSADDMEPWWACGTEWWPSEKKVVQVREDVPCTRQTVPCTCAKANRLGCCGAALCAPALYNGDDADGVGGNEV